MYEFIDQRVTNLDRGGQFLVWSMRNWVLAAQNKRCPPHTIGSAFAKWGMISALPHFHMTMMILSKDAIATLEFSPVGCLQVSDDEAMLLSLFRSIACDRPERMQETLGLIIADDAVSALLKSLVGVTLQLNHANLIPEAPQRRCTQQDIPSHE